MINFRNRIFQRLAQDPVAFCLSSALAKLISEFAARFFPKESSVSRSSDVDTDFYQRSFVPLRDPTVFEIFRRSVPKVGYPRLPIFSEKGPASPRSRPPLSILKRKDQYIPRGIGCSRIHDKAIIQNRPRTVEAPVEVKENEGELIHESVESINRSLKELLALQLDEVKVSLGQELYSVLMEMCGNQTKFVIQYKEVSIDSIGDLHYEFLLGDNTVVIPVSSDTILSAVTFRDDWKGRIARYTLIAGLKACSPKITIPKIMEFSVVKKEESITMQFTDVEVKVDASTLFAIEGVPGFSQLAVHEISLNQNTKEVSIKISGNGHSFTALKTVEEAKLFWKDVWAAHKNKV